MIKGLDDRQKREISIPRHIGIIMDGNGRWAKKKGLPRSAGHKVGANKFREITKYCSKIGVEYLTVYAFSTENWKRPKDEVWFIMKLFKQYMNEALSDFSYENIRVNFLGDKNGFTEDLRNLIDKVEKSTRSKTGMTLNIAMNYGGRDEILKAVKEIAMEAQKGTLLPNDIKISDISDRLYTKNQPDPDLIIRPSGEYRISNFLLWQSAYSEYVFMDDILWPDFKIKDLERAIEEYSNRNRRFGGV